MNLLVILAWSAVTLDTAGAPLGGPVSYELELLVTEGNRHLVTYEPTFLLTKDVTADLREGVGYTARVRAVYKGVRGPWSASITFELPAPATPAAPASLTVSGAQ